MNTLFHMKSFCYIFDHGKESEIWQKDIYASCAAPFKSISIDFGAFKDRLVLESFLLLLGFRSCCFKHFAFCCRRFLPHRRAGAVGSTFCCRASCDARYSFMHRWRGLVLHEGCRMMRDDEGILKWATFMLR